MPRQKVCQDRRYDKTVDKIRQKAWQDRKQDKTEGITRQKTR